MKEEEGVHNLKKSLKYEAMWKEKVDFRMSKFVT
jgi:hypothetical protein